MEKPRKIIADAYAVYIWIGEAGADRDEEFRAVIFRLSWKNVTTKISYILATCCVFNFGVKIVDTFVC